MKYQVSNLPLLKRILWADSFLGGGTALIGLIFHQTMASFLGLPTELVIFIAAITLLYALVALRLARQHTPSTALLRALICANWIWAIISVALLLFFIAAATIFGAAFLILQVIVVGLLAYLEERHVSVVHSHR